MKRTRLLLVAASVATFFCSFGTHAASVGPSGYTNDFSARPAETDWSTANVPGASNEAYDMDSTVNSNAMSLAITNLVLTNALNPPGSLALGVWSTTGQYLQTRPASSRYVMLMGTFVNNSGSNATQVTVSYLQSFAGVTAVEETNKGTRAYYSVSGATSQWVNIPAFSHVISNAGNSVVTATFPVNWPVGSNLFLLWVDDNAIPANDIANQFDNFSLGISVGAPPSLAVTLAPADGTSLLFGNTLALTASPNGGVPPYTVTFNTNGQNLAPLTGTFTTNLGALPVGSYTCHVHASDAALPAAQARSGTNVITIQPNPILATLTSPTPGQTVNAQQPFSLAAVATVGAPLTIASVQFYYDGNFLLSDPTPPYSATITPALGTHTVYAVATDNLGRTTYTETNQLNAVPPANAVIVGPAGYYTEFPARPAAAEWSTMSLGGTATDGWDMDSTIAATINAETITSQVAFVAGTPPAFATAVWSSTGFYVQTRATGNRATILMGKFQNQTGTNATEIDVSYLYTILEGVNEEPTRGTRVYYSRQGVGDWINIPTLNTTAINTGPVAKNVQLNVDWPHGTTLYLLWADDNASGNGSDAAHQLDNFFLGIHAGSQTTLAPQVALTTPTNNASFNAPATIALTATATDSDGTVTNVEFFVDGVRIGADASNPYAFTWTNPPQGPHTLHAVATDNQGATGTSSNAFVVIYDSAGRPYAQILSPTNGAVMQGPTNLPISATAFAIGGVTNVEFYAGNTLIGSTATAGSDNARADYRFQNTLASTVPGAPALSNIGPNTFITTNVDGIPRTVLRFAANNGLGLNSFTSVAPANNYSVVILFAFDTVNSWRRILDFKNASSDNGLYNYESSLYFYPQVIGPSGSFSPGTFVQMVLTRDNTGTVSGYVDGVQLFTVVDSNGDAVVSANNVLRFFLDDSSFEVSAGAVARIRVYDTVLSPAQISALDRLPSAGSYGISWNAPFGSHTLRAVAAGGNGARGTSAPVNITITIPPTNTVAPTVAAQFPVAGATVGSLSSVNVTFSERVVNVNASDLLVNGQPAYGLNGSLSNYTFFVFEPAYGTVTITWAGDHGITDLGYPSNLAFNATGPGATWTYNLVDAQPPYIFDMDPPSFSTVTNLTQTTIFFSEPVSGVDASDLLINGAPAFGMIGSNSTYTFSFSEPTPGNVFFSWAPTHGIADLATSPNPFDGNNNTWFMFLDNRTTLVESNSNWQFIKGLAEASTPIDAWRQLAFDDSSWSNALAPFFFGDPYNSVENPGTFLSDMQGGYTTIYLRKKFNVFGANAVSNLFFNFQSDDGVVVWINGYEVMRFNVFGGDLPYNATASQTAQEPGGFGNQRGAAYFVSNFVNTAAYLLEGENVITVHALNQSLTQSTDFGFNAQLYAYLPNTAAVAPRISNISPPAGELFYLTNITVQFSEGVSNVTASDLLVNGVAATNVTSTTNTTYTFRFAQPAFGPVSVTWAVGHGIVDFDDPPKAFDANGPGATFQYSLVNPSAPTVASQSPLRNATVNVLTQINVLFSEAVANVSAGDLLVNGIPATGLSGSGANYTFTFAQPAYGAVSIGWAGGHGIVDTEPAMNPFDGTRQGNVWSYTLVDQTQPAIIAVNPPAGSQVTNITQVTVTFSEPVTGVDASDLRVNGVAATQVSAINSQQYQFTFAQPNATLVNFTWINTHGIRDLAPVPNSFNSTAPGSAWSYTTPDTVAPSVAVTDPAPFITVPSLTQIRVTFTEPVVGVNADDLRINGSPALSVSGSGAGPYTFSFLPPSNGFVDVRWATNHGITDIATPTPNVFTGPAWFYQLDPNATFAGKVIINEIMFNPRGGLPSQEWIELRNVTTNTISLAGWRFTRGVRFTFPNISIQPNGYLVVAADLPSFQAIYPGILTVVGGWSGSLANSDETIELQTALGETVNEVHYATEGDWARRERGHGAAVIESIDRFGSTATVRIFGHGYNGNDRIMITGADQPEYNGIFQISGVGVSTFSITVPGAPTTPATGPLIARHVIDDNNSGWSWFSDADGFGSSLELINVALPNSSGQNWLTSTNFGGTPGAGNTVAAANIAPLILDTAHFPPVPRSTETVSISARVRDELGAGVSNFTLFYRDHTFFGAGAFLTTNMLDDGAHGDGLINDGLFGAVLPAFANGTVIEFYVQATDSTGLSRTWPAPAWETNGSFGQLANAMYQVDDEVIGNSMPAVRLVMTGTERATFPPGQRNSDAEANNTFINTDGTGTDVRYLAGVRVRGAGSRSRTPPNNRVNIPNDNRWNGLQAVNLNGQFVHAQLMGAAMAQKARVASSPAHLIQYRINGANPAPIGAPANGGNNGAGYGTFIMVHPVNGDLAEELFPEDGDGNVYRASTGQHSAQFLFRTNPDNFLADGYFKTSNQTENDWSDMVGLSYAFSQPSSSAEYFAAMSTNVNVEAWMRYFALGTLLNYGETSLFNGRGDDYALYRGMNDPRFVPIGHDFDTVFGQGDSIDTGFGYYPLRTNASLFIMVNPPNTGPFNTPNIQALRRFMTNEQFAPIFFREVKAMCDTIFAPGELNPMFDQLLTWPNGPTLTTIQEMKSHAQNRRDQALAQIPLTLTVGHTLGTSNGFFYTTVPTVTLFGQSHAIETRAVRVNGQATVRSPWEARWTNVVTLQPGINRVVVQSLDSNNVEFARASVEIWYDDGTMTSVSGAIATDTVWGAVNGPYLVTGNVTVNSGVTLTIQAGATVFLNAGVDIIVANGGRLLAEGTDGARIYISAAPGGGAWGGITINGAPGSPESRISYAHIVGNNDTAIDANGSEVFLDHLTFGTTNRRYIDLDGASFVVQNCTFPATTAGIEPVHGTAGIRAGGRGIVRRNFWGRITAYNDSFDFTGGNRPGPILQVINNVFAGSDDDLLDLDGTDAWVEGNIFLHTHRDGSPDSASAVSGGNDSGQTSEVTMVGNLFYNVDQAALAKQGNFYTMVNNTVVNQNGVGSEDPETAVVILADEGTAQGLGILLEGNIISEAEGLTRHLSNSIVTYRNNLFHDVGGPMWTGPGGSNTTANPLLTYVPPLNETTNFASWEDAQVMWQWFSLRTGSPAAATGPNGRDKGAVVPRGVSVSGEPIGTTPFDTATLFVGVNRTTDSVPTNGFPNGSGYTHYKWRLDGGAWSAETPTATPISLTGLSGGAHHVEVVGKNDAGFYQDDPIFGEDAVLTVSRTWVVAPGASPLRINEALASNGGSVNHFGTTPDVIELYNASDVPLSLTGMRLTDDLDNPDKFIFPMGASIPARSYLVVYANDADGTPGHHLGFSLSQGGESVYLFNAASAGGALIDSVSFGLQLTDLSVGRLADGSWALTVPTFGGANQAAQVGDPLALRINEWLANAQTPFESDFVELYNSDSLPVALGGLYLTDNMLGWPARHVVPALTFMGGSSYLRLLADGDASAGADHLNFALTSGEGAIAILLSDFTAIDCVVYQPQQPNISQGRSPNGGGDIVFFDTPTPGAPNPQVTGPVPFGGALVINEVLASNSGVPELNGRKPDWVELYNGTTNTINLSDFSITDSTLLPRKFAFSNNTFVAAGGYLRILCDDGRPATNNNTGFGLRAAGGAVYLFNSPANGGAFLNSISYGIQTPNLSIGRVPSGSGNWVLNTPTPDAANTAVPALGSVSNLKVNEWVADPESGEDDWLEIYNPNSLPVALGGLYLTDDLNSRTKHQVAPLSFIGTGTNAFLQFHADGNTGAGADHTSFSLRAAGEAVGISATNGALINGATFGQQTPGISEGRFPNGSSNLTSFAGTKSPGESNWKRLTNIVINEVLTHTDAPLEDAIELRNLSGVPVDVGGWWLSDDDGEREKYQIPSPTLIPANGFVVIYEIVFTNAELTAIPFALSSEGDEVVLSAATNNVQTGFRSAVDFGAAANGVSFGRYATSDAREEFVAMNARTFGVDDPGSVAEFRTGMGTNNAYPKVGPVVISEVMYRPPDLGTNDNTRDEFIELRNTSTVAVPLFSGTNGWRLRDAVDFDFAPGTVLSAGATLLVVSFDPVNNPSVLADFRAAYQLATNQPIVGPYSGRLANDSDDIELRRPDAPNSNGVPSILVERVRYFDSSPWPASADGTGLSLQRVSETGFGNDPTNWLAAAPTPGPLAGSFDTDGDGMPDWWEIEHGFDRLVPGDAGLDADGDGLTNLQEYRHATDPRDASSGLKLNIAASGPNAVLSFNAVSNFSYSVMHAETVTGSWQVLLGVSAAPSNRVIQLPVSPVGGSQFYRLRLP